jgi:pyrimidine-nucleoside phosphorylase
MRAVDIIQKKRDGLELSESEINFLLSGYTRGDITDYQMSAFAMAVFFKSMSGTELAHFTQGMLHSGQVLDLGPLAQIAVDKHSTGGVGDKISIPLAPAVAACGVVVPMISGRGLAHTGGTLDKLESIPGFNVNLSVSQFMAQLQRLGCSLIGQTGEIAPADKKLYSLRDVTATVDCIPLIASSIMSKKLAEGIQGLVLDVKFGSGAILTDIAEATKLAKTMVDIGTRMGKNVAARLTNMDQPTGIMVGNSLEILESLDVLEGKGPVDTVEFVTEFGAEMLVLGGVCTDHQQGRAKIREVLSNGKAMEKFAQIIEAQGGNPRICDDRALLGKAQSQIAIKATTTGFLQSMDTRSIGIAGMMLGAGRQKVSDNVDPLVGIEVHVRLGDEVREGQTLFVMHSNGKGEEQARALIEGALHIGDKQPAPPPLFGPRITKKDI